MRFRTRSRFARLPTVCGGGQPYPQSWPREEVAFDALDELVAFQFDLKKLGFDPGDADVFFGRKARAALRAYQKERGLAADGFATQDSARPHLEREIVARGS